MIKIIKVSGFEENVEMFDVMDVEWMKLQRG